MPRNTRKLRAVRACLSCRTRKVRCDASERMPCTNCRLDKVECFVKDRYNRYADTIPGKNSPPNSLAQYGGISEFTTTAAMDAFAIWQNNSLGPTVGVDEVGGVETRNGSRGGYSSIREDACLATPAQYSYPSPKNDEIHKLPFLKPPPSHVSDNEMAYLSNSGVLTAPSPTLHKALLQAYVQYVHPYLPIMDLHEFSSIVYCADGSNGQISLLLYSAVLFAASAYVSVTILREAGYNSTKSARALFFRRCRLLYDFDYECDRLVLVQSLLLMTTWYRCPDEQKDIWHWMGIIVSIAQTIGLHHDLPLSTTTTRSKQKLWRRIWWSCFIRDRLIALGMRRPYRIKDEDYYMPMLAEDDFDIQSSEPNYLPDGNSNYTLMHDSQTQRELALLCISKVKLCICIGHVLGDQFSLTARGNMPRENTSSSTMMLTPNQLPEHCTGVTWLEQELKQWADSLPPACHYRTVKAADLTNGRAAVAVHRSLLHMLFNTTVATLHRPLACSGRSRNLLADQTAAKASQAKMQDAALQIAQQVNELHNFGLERLLPIAGVTVLSTAMVAFIINLNMDTCEYAKSSRQGLGQCMKVMDRLRNVYTAADYATTFLGAALRRAGVEVDKYVDQSTLALMNREPVNLDYSTPCSETSQVSELSATVSSPNGQSIQGQPHTTTTTIHEPSAAPIISDFVTNDGLRIAANGYGGYNGLASTSMLGTCWGSELDYVNWT